MRSQHYMSNASPSSQGTSSPSKLTASFISNCEYTAADGGDGSAGDEGTTNSHITTSTFLVHPMVISEHQTANGTGNADFKP